MRAKIITNPAVTAVVPRFRCSASFRRFAGPMTGEEALLVEGLERQRRQQHRVRAYVADPGRKFSRIIARYIEWLQLFIRPYSDCLMAVRRDPGPIHEFNRIPSVRFNTARSPHRWHGAPLFIRQCVILDADRLCPSLPYRKARLDMINRDFIGTLTLRDSLLIIIGDPFRPRRNRFRQFWQRELKNAETGRETAILLLDPADPAATRLCNPPARSITLAGQAGGARAAPATTHYPLPTGGYLGELAEIPA